MKLTDIKGVGKKKEQLLYTLGIKNVNDLLKYLPMRYEDRSNLTEIVDAKEGIKSYFELEIISISKTYFYQGNKSISRAKARDKSSDIDLIWYNDRYSSKILEPNVNYKFFGYYDGEKKALINPIISRINDDKIGGITPIYKSIKGISSSDIIKYKDFILENYINLSEYLDLNFIKENNIMELNNMYKTLHRPKNNIDLFNAIFSYNLRNVFLDKLAIEIFKSKYETEHIQFDDISIADVSSKLPYELTKSQQNSFRDIEEDMTSAKRMNRIVIGDVGSGKTIVAILSAIKAIRNGYQVAFMAPTEILSIQHYNKYKRFFEELGYNSELLLGSTSTKEKNTIYKDILENKINIVFGTHALFQEKINFNKLGLVIIDEQQRFGVYQRKKIAEKGLNPDLLLLSATPIPRTLALTFYNNLDLSYIDELPSNRLPIKSYLTSIYKEKDFIDFALKQVLDKRQVYIVVSRVEEDEYLESVDRLYRKLKKYFNGNIRLAKLHGQMDAERKEKIQKDFSDGKVDILISTSIIEVGIDVPNANTIIIYDANQFGLSQLHQMRGRVGRSNIQSYAFFVDSEKNPTNEKLEFISKTLDGFEIAKKDLEIRGSGDIYGKNQSGFIEIDNSFILNEELNNLVNELLQSTDKLNPMIGEMISDKLGELEDIIMN